MGLWHFPKAVRGSRCKGACELLAVVLICSGLAGAWVAISFLISPFYLGDGYDFLEPWMMIEDLDRSHELGLKGPDCSWLDVKRLEFAAQFGNGRAIIKLGIMNELGLGVPKDEDAALKYYRQAFHRDYCSGKAGHRAIGILYKRGDCGGISSIMSSGRYFPGAWTMVELGRAYADGKCGFVDFASSRAWLEKAVQRGERSSSDGERRSAVEAMALLSQMCEQGDAELPDPAKAEEWRARAFAIDQQYASELFQKLKPNPLQEALLKMLIRKRQRHALGVFAGEAAWPDDPRNCASAYSQSLKAAQGGDPDAQYRIGAMLFEGRCASADRTSGAQWLKRAASGGSAAAQLAMGAILQMDLLASPGRLEALGAASDQVLPCRLGAQAYEKGPWAAPQCARARAYLEKAAAQGADRRVGTLAMIRLGSMHAAAHEHEQALYWYLRAAARGNALAQFKAGMILLGHRARHDPDQALSLLARSAGGGFPEAYRILGTWHMRKKKTARPDLKKAQMLLREGCALGDGISCIKARFLKGALMQEPWHGGAALDFSSIARNALSQDLPDLSQIAIGTEPFCCGQSNALAQGNKRVALRCADAGERNCAVEWMEKAAAGGDPGAMSTYALWLGQGIATPSGRDEQRMWLERATARGSLEAQRSLALMHYAGQLAGRDCEKASSLLANAASRGDAQAVLKLSLMKAVGCGFEQQKDPKAALGLAQKSCSMGDPEGCRLARLLGGAME